MAIPLIQNVEKQDINTSIIAIKKELQTLQDKEVAVDIDLSDYVKKDDVADVVEADNLNPVTSNAVAQALEDLPQYGTPLGTWASFENDYAPNIEWLQGGTTFNPNTYPALAMYLGGNTVPERFDHSRPSEWETITLPTSSATAITMQYDGILSACLGSSNAKAVYVNGVRVTNGTTLNAGLTFNVEFKKGDTIYVTGSITEQSYVKYYKHPLFIKATPTSADSDYEGTLNAIREFYVRNNTYSTEERLTGGVWIDGKPIYRRTFYSANESITNSTQLAVPNIDVIVNQGVLYRRGIESCTPNIKKNGSGASSYLTLTWSTSGTFSRGTSWSVDYTKTTD